MQGVSGMISMQNVRSVILRHRCAVVCRTVCIVLMALLSGCQDTADLRPAIGSAAATPLKVLATVGMVADLVKQIGGEHTRVTAIDGAGR